MERCILFFVIGCLVTSVVHSDASKNASACAEALCSTGDLSNSYDAVHCYNCQTVQGNFICSPMIQCSSVKQCNEEHSCASTDEVCIINSCCSKPVCISRNLAERSCPISSQRIAAKRSTTKRTRTSTSERCADMEVHVIGVYEASSDHSFGYQTIGNATVRLERPGDQVLVLSSYEPVRWSIKLAANVRLRAVRLIGYYNQTLASSHPGISVTADIQTGASCGYSWPYNGGGCDTNRIINLARQYAGGEIKSFHGCYHASQWKINANFHATSDCATSQQYSWYPTCSAPASQWRAYHFKIVGSSTCSRKRYIRYNAKYKLWIGAILCDSGNRYKLYLSEASKGTYLEIADFNGHGQDHCELVNPSFTIANDGDITSGGCTQCATGDLIDVQNVYVYARGYFGESFQRRMSTFWGDLSTAWYQCGVKIP